MIPAAFAAITLLAPHVPHNERLQDSIQFVAYAVANGLDPLLIVAVAFHESSFNREAVNQKSGAVGLMGISRVHFDYVPGDWIWNIRTGTKLLAKAIHDCGGNIAKGLSLYNGRGKCKVSKYSTAVMKTWDLVRGMEVAER